MVKHIHKSHASDVPGLTKRQLQVMQLVLRNQRLGLLPPSYDEIAAEMRCSRPAAVTKVCALVVKGLLARNGKQHRSLRVTEEAYALLGKRAKSSSVKGYGAPMPAAEKAFANQLAKLFKLWLATQQIEVG